MSAADSRDLDVALQSAVDAFTTDLFKSLEPAAIQALGLIGLAEDFAAEWQSAASYRNLVTALGEDDRFRTVFKQKGSEAPVLYPFLAGSPLWAMKVPAGLLAASCFDLLAADVWPTQETVAAAIVSNVRRLRQIAVGGEVDCAFVAGIDGFELPPGTRLVTKLGVFREAGDLRGAITFFEGRKAATVFCGRLSMRIRVVKAGEVPSEEPAFENIERAGRLVRLAQLGVILADSGLGAPLRPMPTMQIVTSPYSGFMGGMTVPQLDYQPPARWQPLTDSEMSELQTWTDLLSTLPVDRVAIALERIVTASTERTRVEDVLIDSVTAWEGLVGADAETTFRVTASLTQLLEADPANRPARFAELKRIYGDRSKVVHGEPRSARAMRESGDKALAVAKQALSIILSQEPWLLDLRTSSDRSAAILLGYSPGLRSNQEP